MFSPRASLPVKRVQGKNVLLHTAVHDEQCKFILPGGPSGASLVISRCSQSEILPFQFSGPVSFKASPRRSIHTGQSSMPALRGTWARSMGATPTECEHGLFLLASQCPSSLPVAAWASQGVLLTVDAARMAISLHREALGVHSLRLQAHKRSPSQ